MILSTRPMQVDVDCDRGPGEAGAALVYYNRSWHRLGEHSRLD